jgi:hypothetical protein
MTWTQNGHDVESFGAKGHYVIKRSPGFSGCVLTALGHDGLPLLTLPPYGKSFDNVQKAKDYAERIEWVRTVEPVVGGE